MTLEIVYIGASWCSTCKVIKPATVELGKKFDVSVTIKDFDELEEAEKESITKVPTLRILKDGVQIQEWNVKQVQSLTDWLSANIVLTLEDF